MAVKALQRLRERTGATLGACKRALSDAHGDVEAAIALIEERGQIVAGNVEPPEPPPDAPPPPPNAAALPVAEPTLDDEEPLLDAIRARDVERTNALLEGRQLVSSRVVTSALAHQTGVERLVHLPIAKLDANGHLIARELGKYFGDVALRGAVLGRVLDAMPRGFERTDALQVGLNGPFGARTLVAIPGVQIARGGDSKLGAAVRDLAVLMEDGRCVEIREADDAADARAIVESWIGSAPQSPADLAPKAVGVRSDERPSQMAGSDAWSAAPHLRALYDRFLKYDGWSDENAGVRLKKGGRVVVCDPAVFEYAKPLEQAAPPGFYDVFAFNDSAPRPVALLLLRGQDRKRAVRHVAPAEPVSIDTATLLVTSDDGRAVLTAESDGRARLRSLAEAPRGAFWFEREGSASISGYATALSGDVRVRPYWLLDERERVIALLLDLAHRPASAPPTRSR
jgi:hypothetical protein